MSETPATLQGKREELTYGQVLQFRPTRELEEMLRGDVLSGSGLSLSQIAMRRLEIVYGLQEGGHVAHDPKPKGQPQERPTAQALPRPAPPEEASKKVRDFDDGGREVMTVLEIVAHLSRQVMAANVMRVLELRDGRLWPLVDSGAQADITEKLSSQGLEESDGIAGQSIARNQVWFGPIRNEARGTLEADYQTVAAAPIVVSRSDGGHSGPVYGLLFLGYQESMMPTQAGRVNLVSFATALARIWGMHGQTVHAENSL